MAITTDMVMVTDMVTDMVITTRTPNQVERNLYLRGKLFMVEILATPIADLFIVQPKVFEDERGYFYESYNKAVFAKHGISLEFIQDNQSLSQKNVLRGLHFQNPPFEQGKLVRVIKGSVLDVVVDIRKKSKTYGQHFNLILDEHKKNMLWIPPGFAHGFLTLEDNTIFSYKCTNIYDKSSEDCILWDDKNIGIDWNCVNPILSEKDKNGKVFTEFVSQF